MAADALASYVARASVTMVLTVQDKLVPVYHEEGFQLPVPSHRQEITDNVIILWCFRK